MDDDRSLRVWSPGFSRLGSHISKRNNLSHAPGGNQFNRLKPGLHTPETSNATRPESFPGESKRRRMRKRRRRINSKPTGRERFRGEGLKARENPCPGRGVNRGKSGGYGMRDAVTWPALRSAAQLAGVPVPQPCAADYDVPTKDSVPTGVDTSFSKGCQDGVVEQFSAKFPKTRNSLQSHRKSG